MSVQLPATMRAITFDDGGVRVDERTMPVPGPDELLVRVRAAGINNADLLQAAGHYPAPEGWPADVLGMELAGEVVRCGGACTRFAMGDRICAVVGGGAQADYAIVPEAIAMAAPEGISWAQLGAFPEAAATAWDALVPQGALGRGDRLLVTGAAGGVGTMAVQIASTLGAEVVASTRGDQHDDVLRELGASDVVRADHAHEHGTFDVVLELVGAEQLDAHVRALETGGRIVVIGIGAGRRAQLDLLALMQRRGVVRGSTLRARPREEHAAIAVQLAHAVLPLLEEGTVRVPIHASFDLADVAHAHEEFARGGKLGKLVLTT